MKHETKMGFTFCAVLLAACTGTVAAPMDGSSPESQEAGAPDAMALPDAALPDSTPSPDATATAQTFTLGPDQGGATQAVTLSRFPRFRETEVTVLDFRAFWVAGHPGVGPEYAPGTVGGVDRYEDGGIIDVSGCTWSPEPSDLDHYPVTCVFRATAMAFCAWEGGRLPTEAEWEWRARRSAPAMESAPVAVSLRPVRWAGLELEGAYDLEGNVMELVADDYASYGDACWGTPDPLCTSDNGPVARGASYLTGAHSVGTRHRVGSGPDLGFRCVYDR